MLEAELAQFMIAFGWKNDQFVQQGGTVLIGGPGAMMIMIGAREPDEGIGQGLDPNWIVIAESDEDEGGDVIARTYVSCYFDRKGDEFTFVPCAPSDLVVEEVLAWEYVDQAETIMKLMAIRYDA